MRHASIGHIGSLLFNQNSESRIVADDADFTDFFGFCQINATYKGRFLCLPALSEQNGQGRGTRTSPYTEESNLTCVSTSCAWQ